MPLWNLNFHKGIYFFLKNLAETIKYRTFAGIFVEITIFQHNAFSINLLFIILIASIMKYCVELRPMRSHDFSMYHNSVNNEMVLSQIFTAPDFNCLLYTVCKSKISIVKKNTFYSKYLYNTICSSKSLQKIKITQLNFSKKNQNQSLSENPKIWYDKSGTRLLHGPGSGPLFCSPKGISSSTDILWRVWCNSSAIFSTDFYTMW